MSYAISLNGQLQVTHLREIKASHHHIFVILWCTVLAGSAILFGTEYILAGTWTGVIGTIIVAIDSY